MLKITSQFLKINFAHINFTNNFKMKLSTSKHCNFSTTKKIKMIETKFKKTKQKRVFTQKLKIKNMHMPSYINNFQK